MLSQLLLAVTHLVLRSGDGCWTTLIPLLRSMASHHCKEKLQTLWDTLCKKHFLMQCVPGHRTSRSLSENYHWDPCVLYGVKDLHRRRSFPCTQFLGMAAPEDKAPKNMTKNPQFSTSLWLVESSTTKMRCSTHCFSVSSFSSFNSCLKIVGLSWWLAGGDLEPGLFKRPSSHKVVNNLQAHADFQQVASIWIWLSW